MTRWAVALCVLPLAAQTVILPLGDVRAGMKGVGKTIFTGDRIEEFQVEILGVLENPGPKQSLILCRLSGGPLSQTGVMQGMSGSPVYIDGKLVGAVASAFAFSKEPIAGIRPIEEMLAAASPPAQPIRRAHHPLAPAPLAEMLPARMENARMVDIATPLAMAGFTSRTLDHFTPSLRTLGLEPMQGTLGGNSGAAAAPRPLQPGSMISVQLITGDLMMGADGTVTHIDGNRVYAFGHRFLSVGATEIPFARAEVLTVLPSLNTSFKISSARELLGTITADHSTAVTGELGRSARAVPFSVKVHGGRESTYRMQLVRDRLLTPFLLQVVTFSAIDATERVSGAATITVRGRIEFAKAKPIDLANVYTGETAVVLPASLVAAVPLGYAMQSGFPEFDPRQIELNIAVTNERKQYTVEQLWASRTTAKPGETVELHVRLTGPGGDEIKRTFPYRIPPGMSTGTLQVTVADALTANLADFAATITQPPTSVVQVASLLHSIRPNNVASVRVLRSDPSFLVAGQTLPDPPSSLALVLRRQPASATPATQSKIADFDLRIADGAISGSKSMNLDVKE